MTMLTLLLILAVTDYQESFIRQHVLDSNTINTTKQQKIESKKRAN